MAEKIQRYSLELDQPGVTFPDENGEYVLFTDACAAASRAIDEAMDKAVAVEQKKTKEMRAELVASLAWSINVGLISLDGGWYPMSPENQHPYGMERLVEFGVWEKETQNGVECYRPVESQDSGESDEN